MSQPKRPRKRLITIRLEAKTYDRIVRAATAYGLTPPHAAAKMLEDAPVPLATPTTEQIAATDIDDDEIP
jgi:hypothetical protein